MNTLLTLKEPEHPAKWSGQQISGFTLELKMKYRNATFKYNITCLMFTVYLTNVKTSPARVVSSKEERSGLTAHLTQG